MKECKNALGMRSKAILDDSITASSSYDQAQVGPENARRNEFCKRKDRDKQTQTEMTRKTETDRNDEKDRHRQK
ncbi:hypothetical protein ACOMHN_007302 [Nucella lapillus]